MPFDPATAFPLADPAGADGIDDWFVPWSAQTDASFPDDWIYPDNRNAPTSAAAPSTTPPAPSPQPNAPDPSASNRPAPLPDPFAVTGSISQTETGTANPNVIPVADDEKSLEQHELEKFKTRFFGGRTETTVTLPRMVPAFPAPPPRALPSRPPGPSAGGPRPSSPSTSAQ